MEKEIFIAETFDQFTNKYLVTEGTISQIKAKVNTILDRLEDRIAHSSEKMGFDIVKHPRSKCSVYGGLTAKIGKDSAYVYIYDDDDFNVEVIGDTDKRLDIASYSSFKDVNDVVRFLNLMASKIKEHNVKEETWK